MSVADHDDRAADGDKTPLAELSEQITRRLQAGEPVEADDYLDAFPTCSGPIRRLLPTLRDLAELGRSVRRSPVPGSSTDPRSS